MIDDIAGDIVKTLFGGIFRFLFKLIIEILFYYTGEFLLFIATFGKRRIRGMLCEDESPSKWVMLSEFSTWIGAAFWLFVAWYINTALTN